MANINLSFLDPLHESIEQAVRENVPNDWDLVFASSRDEKAQVECIKTADVAFLLGMEVSAELISAAPHLKFVQKLGAGVDNIDTKACVARGIGVARIQGGNATPVAEHTILLMLGALRRLPRIDRWTREGQWPREESRGIHRQIFGRQVGIVGFGAIGKNVAKLLTGFGAKVVYYDPVACDPRIARDLRATATTLDELLQSSDVVTLHFPFSHKNANFINKERIAMMKQGAVLVNCARGGVLDEDALLTALNSGHLMGASLDVFSSEPPQGSPLLENEAIIVTPHTAGGTRDNFVNILKRGIKNTELFLSTGEINAFDVVN